MKTLSTLFGCGLVLLSVSAQAQGVLSDVVTRKPKVYDVTNTYRLGIQNVSLGGLAPVLEQTGYRALPNQFTIFGVTTEATRNSSRWKMLSQFDFAINRTKNEVTNGTNTVRGAFFQYGVGGGYSLLHTSKFTLTPKLMLSPAFFSMKITRNDAPAPSLTAALVDPGSQQTANFFASALTGDLGLSGQYRFTYKAKTTQTDCGPQTRERSLVVGFDAGYRLSTNGYFNESVNDRGASRNTADNPAINLSGWYVAARIGFGNRYAR